MLRKMRERPDLKRENGRRFLRRLFCGAACVLALCSFTGETVAWGEGRHFAVPEHTRQLPRSAQADKVRLAWPLIPGAVRYQVVLLSAPEQMQYMSEHPGSAQDPPPLILTVNSLKRLCSIVTSAEQHCILPVTYLCMMTSLTAHLILSDMRLLSVWMP